MASRSVQVVARLRPPLSQEEDLCTFADSDDKHVDIVNYRNEEETLRYNFSRVFGDKASQSDIFSGTVDPVLDDLFQGYNASVLAYGPTGAGKTYTTLGSAAEPGIIPRAVSGLLERMALNDQQCDSKLVFSYFEIYNEKLQDLLVKDQSTDLIIREDAHKKIRVQGLTEKVITNIDEFTQSFGPASKRRTVASTKLNQHSSRSHSILLLKLKVQPKNSRRSLCGKLHIIDLAGSENNKRTGNRGIRLKESGAINNSLFVLGQVVEALNNNMARIPYRDSKLTRLLQDSFGGNAQSLVITNLAPELSHYMLTYTTLNFAQKTRQVINKPTVNEATPIRPRFQPVLKAPRVEFAEPDSSSLPPAQSLQSVSFTPLRESLLSPINHTRNDINYLNQRMEKLESLMSLQASMQNNMVANNTVLSENSNQEMDDKDNLNETKKGANDEVKMTEQEVQTREVETETVKENRSPSPVPLKRLRRQFDWGSPLGKAESPIDSSVLFVQRQNPIRRKKAKSTAATQTPAKVKAVTLPAFETSYVDPDVKKSHNEDILRILNTGDLKALCKLATMGAKRSQAVIDYRKYVGAFNEILDICKVPAFTKASVGKFLKANYIDLST